MKTKYTDLAAKLHADTVANGGATYRFDTETPSKATFGYVVGGIAGFSIVIPVTAGPEDYEKAIITLQFNTPDPIKLIGTWVEESHVFIDVSEWVRFRADALTIARSRGEIAIFDVDAGVSVTV